MLRRLNILIVIAIILCSTSFYQLTALGNLSKVIEILGIIIIFVFLLLHIIYARKQNQVPKNFGPFIALILISFITSAFMADYTRDQSFSQTLLAQRALLYYLFYFLLHQLQFKIRDLERIFILFGAIFFVLYLLQFFAYPKIIFDAFILADRGTIRIYLAGSDYLAVAFFIFSHKFFWSNNFKYLLFALIAYSIYVLMGGRQTMVLMALTFLIFMLFSRKVKSRFGISIIIVFASILVLFLFQDIFQQIVLQSKKDQNLGKDYIRIVAGKFYLTEFYKSPIAYLTGNGTPAPGTAYGREIDSYRLRGFYLGDLGTIGLYVLFGPLFLFGLIGICYKGLTTRLSGSYLYLRYMFLGIILSLLTGAGFGNADFIVFITACIYIIDVSNYSLKKTETKT